MTPDKSHSAAKLSNPSTACMAKRVSENSSKSQKPRLVTEVSEDEGYRKIVPWCTGGQNTWQGETDSLTLSLPLVSQ